MLANLNTNMKVLIGISSVAIIGIIYSLIKSFFTPNKKKMVEGLNDNNGNGNGNDNGCTIPDSEPTFTPCKTWELTGNTQDFVVDYTDCEGVGATEEVPVGVTVTRCASNTPTSVGTGGGTISVAASTCPSVYGYPTAVAWVDATYENLSNDGSFYGDAKLRVDNYNTGAFQSGLSGIFFDCDPNAISAQSVVTDCTTLTEFTDFGTYAVHQDSLVDPTVGHQTIAFSSAQTSITLSECSAVNITLNVSNSISGGNIGTAYDVTVLAENTTTGNQITYTNLSSNAVISGLPGAGYSFTTTVAAKTGYIFSSGPSFSNTQPQTGLFGSTSSSISLGISGDVISTTPQYRLLVTTQGGGDPNFTDPLCVGDGPWPVYERACRCGTQTTPLESVYFDPSESQPFFAFPIVGAKLYADATLTTPFTGFGTDYDSDPGGVGLTTKTGFVKYYTWSTISSCNSGPACTTATYEFQYNYNNGTLVDVEYIGIEAGQFTQGCCVNQYIGGVGCTNY